MKLPDRLHCPNCKHRLAAISKDALHCPNCDRMIAIIDGIADFVADSKPQSVGIDEYRGRHDRNEADARDLLIRVRSAASDRWPISLGAVIEFACGHGETTHAIAAEQSFQSLLAIDTEIEALRACQARLMAFAAGSVGCATLNGQQDAVRDAVADTVFGFELLSGIGDIRAFLRLVHRVLRPGGRAVFVVRNRRYQEAMCLALAEALVHRYTRDGVWPEGQEVALELLSKTRRLLVHRGNEGFLSGLAEKHLFDSEALEDLGREVGFASAEMIPLDPDATGAETMRRLWREAGAQDSFTDTLGPLAAMMGQAFFSPLALQDRSASMLFWLTKNQWPVVKIFTHRAMTPVMEVAESDVVPAGAPPRWSIELSAHDTAEGIAVSVGGWCLCNVDVEWVRLTLAGVTGYAPVWRPRPDVHEVLNRAGLYRPLNTLCSGLASELLFEGAHPSDNACSFRLEVVLAGGLVVTGSAPETLAMDERVVIAQ